MTENKRFDLVCDDNVEWLMQSKLFLPIKDKNTNKKITLKQCYDLLNSLAQNEQLKRSDKIIYLETMIKKLEEENKKLQAQIKCENIYFGYLKILEDWNKKVEKENKELKKEIAQLKQRIKSVTETLNKLNDEKTEFKKENEQLKEQLEICKDARQSYKQDWKACVSYCDTYEDEIHTLKDNIQGLIEENKQLKKEVEDLKQIYQKKEITYDSVDEAIYEW